MIPELKWLTLVFLVAIGLLWALAESETLREYSERQNVNRLADRSRRSKPQSVRPRSRYIWAGIQK